MHMHMHMDMDMDMNMDMHMGPRVLALGIWMLRTPPPLDRVVARSTCQKQGLISARLKFVSFRAIRKDHTDLPDVR